MLSSCSDPVAQKVNNLDQKIVELDQRIADLEARSIKAETESVDASTNSDSSANPSNQDQTADNSEIQANALTEYPFESCKSVSEYSTDDWFSKFKDAFALVYPAKSGDDYYPNFAKLTNSCYSSVGKVFLFLQPGAAMNAGFHLFKYDIASNKITEAYIQSAGLTTFASPSEFGRRNKELISMIGTAQKEACTESNTFSYNYIENILYLKESCNKCPDSDRQCKNF